MPDNFQRSGKMYVFFHCTKEKYTQGNVEKKWYKPTISGLEPTSKVLIGRIVEATEIGKEEAQCASKKVWSRAD